MRSDSDPEKKKKKKKPTVGEMSKSRAAHSQTPKKLAHGIGELPKTVLMPVSHCCCCGVHFTHNQFVHANAAGS